MYRFIIFLIIFGFLIGGFIFYLKMNAKQSSALQDQKNREEAQTAGAVVIAETAVADFGDVQVPISGYLAQDPSFSGGPRIRFHLPTGVLDVTVGSTFDVASQKYQVLNIWEDQDGHGYVSYKEVSSQE